MEYSLEERLTKLENDTARLKADTAEMKNRVAEMKNWFDGLKITPLPKKPDLPKVSKQQRLLLYALREEYFLKPPGVDPRPIFAKGGPWVMTESEWNELNLNLKI